MQLRKLAVTIKVDLQEDIYITGQLAIEAEEPTGDERKLAANAGKPQGRSQRLAADVLAKLPGAHTSTLYRASTQTLPGDHSWQADSAHFKPGQTGALQRGGSTGSVVRKRAHEEHAGEHHISEVLFDVGSVLSAFTSMLWGIVPRGHRAATHDSDTRQPAPEEPSSADGAAVQSDAPKQLQRGANRSCHTGGEAQPAREGVPESIPEAVGPGWQRGRVSGGIRGNKSAASLAKPSLNAQSAVSDAASSASNVEIAPGPPPPVSARPDAIQASDRSGELDGSEEVGKAESAIGTTEFHIGRPKLEKVFREADEAAVRAGCKRVAVLVCGNQHMLRSALAMVVNSRESGVVFSAHYEAFGF